MIAGKKGVLGRRLSSFALSFGFALVISVFAPSVLISALVRGKPPLGEFVIFLLFPLWSVAPYLSPVGMALERTRWGKSHRDTLRKAGQVQKELVKKKWEMRIARHKKA
jgi:O-antigen ligase